MQGYVRVSPAGSSVPLTANISKKALAQISRAKADARDAHEGHDQRAGGE
jgi:hypothetical protein